MAILAMRINFKYNDLPNNFSITSKECRAVSSSDAVSTRYLRVSNLQTSKDYSATVIRLLTNVRKTNYF